MNLGFIKLTLEELPFYWKKNYSSHNLESTSDHRLIIRAVDPYDVYYRCDYDGYKRLTECTDINLPSNNFIILKFYSEVNVRKMVDKEETMHTFFDYDIIFKNDYILLYEELGDINFQNRFNCYRYNNVIRESKKLYSELTNFETRGPQYNSISHRIQILDQWTLIYSDWFLKNGFNIPEFKESNTVDFKNNSFQYNGNSKFQALQTELDKLAEEVTTLKESNFKLEEDNKSLNRELAIRNEKVLELRRRTKSLKYVEDVEELKKVIDKTRFKNNKHNYTQIGKAIGCNHETAKKLVEKMGLKNY